MREAVTEENRNIHEFLFTQQCQAKPSETDGGKPTAMSEDKQ